MRMLVFLDAPLCLDGIIVDHRSTVLAMNRETDPLLTTDLSSLSFDNIMRGYDNLFVLGDVDGVMRCVRMESGMTLACGKKIRLGHNLERIVKSGMFGDDDLRMGDVWDGKRD